MDSRGRRGLFWPREQTLSTKPLETFVIENGSIILQYKHHGLAICGDEQVRKRMIGAEKGKHSHHHNITENVGLAKLNKREINL